MATDILEHGCVSMHHSDKQYLIGARTIHGSVTEIPCCCQRRAQYLLADLIDRRVQ